jgi:GNAT superfamily N-acetyltransferase
MAVTLTHNAPITGEALNALWADSWEHVGAQDWETILARSLGLVCAMDDERFVGFVNVVWDGGSHAFVIDTLVAERARRRGIGAELVKIAERESRAAGCEWLHVDFEDHLRAFYVDACGFTPTNAGLIEL